MTFLLSPGVLVRHPAQKDWGIGCVQSCIGHRVTVNFENAGKRLINAKEIDLIIVERGPKQRFITMRPL